MTPGDDILLERARAGDRAALDELLARHERRVYRFGLRLCRDPEDAKDILQETLLAVARTVKDFRGASSVSTWLYTIARSFCIKKRRRSRFAPAELESLDANEPARLALEVADPARPADESLAGRQVERALEAAIAALDPMYRDVLVLRDVEGLTAPEVGEVMGLSVEAVKSRLHRARLQVRAAVAPLLAAPPEGVAPGTACPDVLELFSRHEEGEISASVCAEMERHLAGCPACRARCDSLRATLALCQNTPLPEVPAGVQASVRRAIRELLQRPA